MTTLTQYRPALPHWQDVPAIRLWLISSIRRLEQLDYSANKAQNRQINQCLQG